MKMTSEIGRMLKCLTTKSYHSLQDDAYSHIHLIPQGDTSAESLDCPPSLNQIATEDGRNQYESISGIDEKVRSLTRQRSSDAVNEEFTLGDVVGDTVRYNSQVIEHLDIAELRSRGHNISNSGSVSRTNLPGTNSANGGGSSSSSAGSGILSFFGVKFNKSGTRHLDRGGSLGETIAEKPSKTVVDHRYTKFPLSASTSPAGGSQSSVGALGNCQPKSGFNCQIQQHTHQQSSPEDVFSTAASVRTPLASNSLHTHLAPQSKTFSHANKVSATLASPTQETANTCSTTASFIVNAVSSLGRKAVHSVNVASIKSNQLQKGKTLKVKSKSDNNLHRVTLNTTPCSVGAISLTETQNQSFLTSPQNDSNPREDQWLNSVQLGDHATIRLPWTGFQQNDLSTATVNRPHPNTHNNNLDFENIRYVECVRLWSNGRSSNQSSFPKKCESTNRRRSRSLERCSNFRVFPVNNCNKASELQVPAPEKQKSKRDKDKNKERKTHSLERRHSSQQHRIRHSLSPAEQEILLRNLRPAAPNLKPLFPEKTSLGRNFDSRDNSGDFENCAKSLGVHSKLPPIGKFVCSSQNSSFSHSSGESSGESASFSAPPSPPPRPPSTLKANSRPILSKRLNIISTTKKKRACSPIPSEDCSIMNSAPRRPPLVPASQGEEQSESGVTTNVTSGSSSTNTDSLNHSEPVVTIHTHSALTSRSGIHHRAGGMSLEDARTSGFINKPSKGWLHSDQLLTKEGVTYTVRYIGCLDVNTSMKSLDFDTRSLIAKECINQVCEAAGLKSVDRKRKIDRRVVRILGTRPSLENAGSDVHLTITSTCLKLTNLDTRAVVAVHDMPNISFASGGDATMLDFVAYVAKDSIIGRACFVLECGSGLAQDVITTVGQAFELRFKEYLQKRPQPQRSLKDDPEYYNDLPGKLPPEATSASGDSSPKEPKLVPSTKTMVGSCRKEPPPLTLSALDKDFNVNLIDFEAPTPPAFGPSTQDKTLESLLLSAPPAETSESTDSQSNGIGTGLGLTSLPGLQKDPFDMQPFGASIGACGGSSPETKQIELESQVWFHGTISRSEAEVLLQHDGDFLVRESQTTPSQYVLTGLQNGTPKHLLLVDPEGIVRTKDLTFDSVIHLIRHHSDNSLPIISAESMVLLRNPVPRVISS